CIDLVAASFQLAGRDRQVVNVPPHFLCWHSATASAILILMTAEPRTLILETSGRIGYVALAEGGRLRGVRKLDEARPHARDLAPAVRDLLAEAGWTAPTLNAVIVSRGPGSYTGLRVGIMSAKTLAYATGCKLVAIDTFAAIAHQALADVVNVDVLADAQQNRVHLERFARFGGRT